MTTDIKTVWDVNALLGDWQTGNGGLLEGDDLQTAILLSLFTDRIALIAVVGGVTVVQHRRLARGSGYCGVRNSPHKWLSKRRIMPQRRWHG